MKTTRRRFDSTRFRLVGVVSTLVLSTLVRAQDPLTKDVAGHDHSLLKRYEGSFIAAYNEKEYGPYKLILGKALNPSLESSGGKQIEKEQTIEGKVTRITYFAPKGRSVLEVFQNYEQEVKTKNAETLFTSAGADELGYDFGSVPQYQDLDGQVFNYSYGDARYGAYKIGDTYVVIYVSAFEHGDTKHLIDKGQTAVQVDIIEAKPMQQKMVTVSADEMEKSLSRSGRIALYGIYFDFNKSDVKPDSKDALTEIASLMNSNPALEVLIVGHTDSIGGFESNKALSQRRAEAVVAALTSQYGIASQRLFPTGVSFAAPIESNESESGRAKNRRVELVKIVEK